MVGDPAVREAGTKLLGLPVRAGIRSFLAAAPRLVGTVVIVGEPVPTMVPGLEFSNV